MQKTEIIVKGANENNLRSLNVEIPHNKLTVITGVSGSGKSSLAFDILFNEGQRRYLETFSSRTRQHLGKMMRPNVEHISGLRPAVSVNQRTVVRSPRSTVGTLSEVYDFLRLLFARKGVSPDPEIHLSRNLFSFNSSLGACQECKGLGVTDMIDADLFIADPNLTIREGALTITTPSGYIIYSQVTMDVMNQVCNAEGFNVDIPWKDLTQDQKKIVLYGSDKIKIQFGKHTLESRMKWSGITAKPREEDYYKGIIPVMEEILKRDRNKNILRFARTMKCTHCNGSRLSEKALSVSFEGNSIADFSEWSIHSINQYFKDLKSDDEVTGKIGNLIISRTDLLIQLGLGYLSLLRESSTLSGGEAQRIRLANQAGSELQGLLYVLDEPSIGLHDRDNEKLIFVLRRLVNNGNTVIVVEHDETIIRNADWIIDIGPGAGKNGGRKLFSGKFDAFLSEKFEESSTARYLKKEIQFAQNREKRTFAGDLKVIHAKKNNLKDVNVSFKLGMFNVVTGVSGAGKSSLIEELLDSSVKHKMNGAEQLNKVLYIDQSPIGRTPRSNPATYTKVFDHIRELFANQKEAKDRKWKKNHFSFNVKGGRCETCQGAGYEQIGMHFLGDVDIQCSDCKGKRFSEETLNIIYRKKNIYDILEMQVDEACVFFKDQPKIIKILETLNALGLGYISLGQSATTFSGGEAQRIKLAAELSKSSSTNTLYILDEPTTGLHFYDVEILLKAILNLVELGNTIICIEHHMEIINCADHVIDVGSESGMDGGEILFEGEIDFLKNQKTETGLAFKNYLNRDFYDGMGGADETRGMKDVVFEGVTTNNLRGVDVVIPRNQVTAIVGVSGSGKSSFAFNTLFSEGQNRFAENLGAYARTQLSNKISGSFDYAYGLTSTIAVSQKSLTPNPRSTVGTITEIYDYYRLLFARFNDQKARLLSSVFSFNHKDGACPYCKGLGTITTASPVKLITNPEKSILDGAMNGTKTGKFYGDTKGQYIAIIKALGGEYNLDLKLPYQELDENTKSMIMNGTGSEEYDVAWHFERSGREGIHKFRKSWEGLITLVNAEYERKHADKRADAMMNVMENIECIHCEGSRINVKSSGFTFRNKTIQELSCLPINQSTKFFSELLNALNSYDLSACEGIISEILKRQMILIDLGLAYLSIDRLSGTLSGGESQRLRLATLLSGELTGITYILDEPTMGLHPKDYHKLFDVIRQLKNLGNTVVIVEHDPYMIRSADHIIEFGPGSGKEGGNIIFQGPFKNLIKAKTETSKMFSEQIQKVSVVKRAENFISVQGANANNLKDINVKFPVNSLSVIKGVSGAGKSSLLFEVLQKSFQNKRPYNCNQLDGFEYFRKILDVRQMNHSGGVTSNLLTYTGIYEDIRKAFAESPLAKKLGLNKSHFSFNQKGGRCEACKGLGAIKIPMDLLPDIWQKCETCGGKRFKKEVLSCTINAHSINDILNLTVEQLESLFLSEKNYSGVKEKLSILVGMGLKYLICGQSTSSLSGGETQRLQLAKEILNSSDEPTLILLDEPTTGLHFSDVKKLVISFQELISKGHTLIVIEHNDIFDQIAHHIVELGPEGGELGGYIQN